MYSNDIITLRCDIRLVGLRSPVPALVVFIFAKLSCSALKWVSREAKQAKRESNREREQKGVSERYRGRRGREWNDWYHTTTTATTPPRTTIASHWFQRSIDCKRYFYLQTCSHHISYSIYIYIPYICIYL